MISFTKLVEEDDGHPINGAELNHLEKYLDSIWKHLGIEFEFTRHFFERVNDPRNGKQITAKEIAKIFSDTYKKFGSMIKSKVKPESEKEFQSVLTDLSTKLNSPVVVEWDSKAKELVMKAITIMRKDHFHIHPSDQRLTVESFRVWLGKCVE